MVGLADDTDALRYLSAFKQRALDAALESGARVKGVAYIDDQGRLHERAMFSTEADVRGIQVESYLEAMGGEEGLMRFRSLTTPGANCGREAAPSRV